MVAGWSSSQQLLTRPSRGGEQNFPLCRAHCLPLPSASADVAVASGPASGSASAATITIGTEQLPEMEMIQRTALCDSGLPDVDECLIAEPPAASGAMTEALTRWIAGWGGAGRGGETPCGWQGR